MRRRQRRTWCSYSLRQQLGSQRWVPMMGCQVKASIVLIKSGEVHKGIVELVSKHDIRKLVMGAAPDACMKVKRSSAKASYAAKNASLSCEIWFVNKGKHVWTREASEGPSSLLALPHPPKTALAKGNRSKSSHSCSGEPDCKSDHLRSTSSTASRFSSARNSLMTEPDEREAVMSSTDSNFDYTIDPSDSRSSTCLTISASGLTWTTEAQVSPEFNVKLEEREEIDILYNVLIEAKKDAEKSKQEALTVTEQLKCKQLESEAADAINRIKDSEVACAHELELSKEVENELLITKLEYKKLSEQRDEAMRELDKTMRNLTVLDGHVREAEHRQDEATGELNKRPSLVKLP